MRIFWLGMHKVLVGTELKRLRQLGFEVYNPPYLSDVQDQSASKEWDANQPSTLPVEIFKKLSSYNFFYNPISDEIAEILNSYFDVVVVTIAVPWLVEILRVYKKKIIYRVYGQSYPLAHELWHQDAFKHITERDDFWFVPHSAHSIQGEHKWLRDREIIVPYSLPDDVFSYKDTWTISGASRKEIMTTCPNINNPYYADKFRYLNENFHGEFYKCYGVQLSKSKNPRIIGTLPRDEYIKRYVESLGYFYFYTDPNVCYLPPIEMMIVGGPVVFLKGSLLDKYFEGRSKPGCALDEEDAREKCRLVYNRDQKYIQEVIASQQEVRKLYSPEYVWPLFDSVFTNLLSQETANKASHIEFKTNSNAINNEGKERIYLLHHFPGQPVLFDQGDYSAFDGIPRVMRLTVEAICKETEADVIVTCRKEQLVNFYGFFSRPEFFSRIKLLVVDEYSAKNLFNSSVRSFKRHVKMIVSASAVSARILRYISKNKLFSYSVFGIAKCLRVARRLTMKLYRLIRNCFPFSLVEEVPFYIRAVNADDVCRGVIIPHYYLFPEALSINKPLALYLPDYTPHFFEDKAAFGKAQNEKAAIGMRIAGKAEVVFTNSHFSKSYLPVTKLKVNDSKIKVFYLPNLNQSTSQLSPANEISEVQKRLVGIKYICYPTQVRPNKNIPFLLSVFSEVRKEYPDLKLVLTGLLDSNIEAMKRYHQLKLEDHVVFFPGISDHFLSFLYLNAEALCLTSLMEGNFPPQIFEALECKTPIIATRLPLITERLNDKSDSLLLCEPSDLEGFVQKILFVLRNREQVVIRQSQVIELLKGQSTWSQFSSGIRDVCNLLYNARS